MIEVQIDSIRVSLVSHHRIVVLKDGEGRYLPIWIGPFEADAITVALQGQDVARPLTHDLLKNVISETGAVASHIFVSELRDDIFFARIVMDVNGRHVEVDSRPSDAIALAVRLKVPIYVEDSVLERAGVALEANEEPITSKSDSRIEQDDENLDAYRDFINSLDVLD